MNELWRRSESIKDRRICKPRRLLVVRPTYGAYSFGYRYCIIFNSPLPVSGDCTFKLLRNFIQMGDCMINDGTMASSVVRRIRVVIVADA